MINTTQKQDVSTLVFIQNNQVLTSSLDIARYFEKEHSVVIRRIKDLQEQMASQSHSTILQDANPVFIETSYQAEQGGRNYPLYYLNRDAFVVLTMGFTGKIALQFKLSYIGAFNRMEKQLRDQQQNKPMTPLEMWRLQLQIAEDHENRLNSLETDIKQLRDAHNGVSFRHELTDIKQQEQLDRHETDIADIKVTISERSPRANIKALIEDTVRKYANTEFTVDYSHAYTCFYQKVKAAIGFDVLTEHTKLQQRRREEGWSDNKVSKISKIDVIEEHPEIWSAVKVLISNIREENNI